MRIGQTRLRLFLGEISEAEVDAIVCPSNQTLDLDVDISKVVRRLGGREMLAECRALAPIEPGGVAVTGAGSLPAFHVIHAVGFRADGHGAPVLIDKGLVPGLMRRTLEAADEHDLISVALPFLGLADVETAAAMVDVIQAYLLEGSTGLEEILFVITDRYTAQVLQRTSQSRLGWRLELETLPEAPAYEEEKEEEEPY